MAKKTPPICKNYEDFIDGACMRAEREGEGRLEEVLGSTDLRPIELRDLSTNNYYPEEDKGFYSGGCMI